MNCLVDDTTGFNRIACNKFLHIQISSCSQQSLSLVPACSVHRNCHVYISCQRLLQKTTGEYETSLGVYSISSTILVSVTIAYEVQGVPGYSQMNCEILTL